MNYLAFLGTGPCDPNKDLKQFLAFAGVVAGWAIIVFLIRKLNRSSKTNGVKIAVSVLLISAGIVGFIIILLATWLGLACSR
jgi:hypothetical protein